MRRRAMQTSHASRRMPAHLCCRRGLAVAILASCMTTLGGCYKHVTNAGFTSTDVRETYEPNVEEVGPSWIDQFMWGDPPKGEDAMSYYRRMNSLGLQK
jgi:hypothetical protein